MSLAIIFGYKTKDKRKQNKTREKLSSRELSFHGVFREMSKVLVEGEW